MEINGVMRCENCFEEIKERHCPYCGYDPADIVSDNTLLLPGSILSENYIIGGVIGIGGFGVTYLAYNRSEDSKAAVKEYFPRNIAHRASNGITVNTVSADDSATFEAGMEKLYNEAEIVSEFKDNPNIVTIYDVFRANNTVYLTMEFLRGKTLKEYIRDYKVLDPPRTVYVAQCVLNALSAMHGANVLHRDISPDNIILCGNGNVKLIDFGAARQIVAERTQNFSAIVKFGFAPPEQYRKKDEQGPWSDIYSLGATLYYALTGDVPSDPMSRFDNDDTFNENNFGIDEGLWSVIAKATKLNSSERYKNSKEMNDALKQLSFVPEPVTFSDEEIFSPKLKSHVASAVSAPVGKSKQDAKKSFWAKHGRIAAAAGGAAVIATCVIVSISINSSDTAVPASTSPEPISSESAATTASDHASPDTSDVSVPDEPPVPLTETYPYFAKYKTKAWYSNLNEREREIYEIIYNGLTEGIPNILFPRRTYTVQEVRKCYFQVVYDNPWICNVGDYGSTGSDDNNNGGLDPDEYIHKIEPDYLNFDMDVNTFRESIEEMLNGTDRTDSVEALRHIHDKMIIELRVVPRYTSQYCTHAYGSIVYKSADDMGFAQGFCVYAQALGLPCRVIDGTKDGEVRAWCAVKIDDTWYNIDVYGDMFAHNEVSNTKTNTDRNAIFHTYFLAGNEHFKELGYVPDGGWEALGGGEFTADSTFDNYYIRHIQGVEEYFCGDVQSAYDRLLQKAADAVESGENVISVYLAPYLVDELYDKMNDSFISDCKEKYGVSISGYRIAYSPTAYSVTLKL